MYLYRDDDDGPGRTARSAPGFCRTYPFFTSEPVLVAGNLQKTLLAHVFCFDQGKLSLRFASNLLSIKKDLHLQLVLEKRVVGPN